MSIDSLELVETTFTQFHNRRFFQLIDGKLTSGSRTVGVVDPATERLITDSPVADTEQVRAAVAAATKAFQSWRTTSFEERARVVSAIADVVEEHSDELSRLTTLEQGKLLDAARGDTADAVAFLRWFAEWRPEPDKVLRDDADQYVVQRRRPMGVVAAIVPWNFPLFQALYKLAPALMTGNTVVVKPAPTTPLNTLRVAELIADIVPAGVVNIVGDDGDAGPALTAHPDVAHVSFTGSTAVGKHIVRNAADHLTRVTLELGGNDAAIVLEDVDVATTAAKIYQAAFAVSGQVCICAKRIYVHASIYDEFCTALAELASAARCGHGLDSTTDTAPVQNAKQFAAAQGALKQAAQDGTVIAGGSALVGPGYFIEPTVVRDIDESSEIVRNETFAPIRFVLRYDSVDEAITRANDTVYGLGGSVWSADADVAWELAGRLECGTAWVNQHLNVGYDIPFGGHKQSGWGSEFGAEGFDEFTNLQIINQRRR